MLSWQETIRDCAALARQCFVDEEAQPSVAVIENASAKTPREATLIFRRGGGSLSRDLAQRQGTFSLLIECWAYAEDSSEANQELEDLENHVLELLNEFVSRTRRERGLQVDLSVSVQPDGDFFRPAVASQLSVEFRWRVRRPVTPL